ncbi:MAG: long-chain fatty acid--CoA ligase [Bacteroidetes bacterium]|nr:long-chain fatty acid--CoA ligase [Bacteroidota bacterium]MDA1334321.1 long-chain fatty acid--CoA ligase [Bacteroidota bacterium]
MGNTKGMTARDNIAKHVGRPSHLGRTLPSLLYRATASHPNARAFSQKEGAGWRHFSSEEFRTAAEELAVGLLDIGMRPGDRIALYQDSDVYYCLADMGTLIAGMVNVPVYLTHTPETIKYVLNHADAHAVIATAGDRFDELVEALEVPTNVHTIILTQPADDINALGVPEGIRLMTLPDVRARGRVIMASDPGSVRSLSDRLEPRDLATIIYTSGTTGLPKGVMLTHENISSNALMAYAGMDGYRDGMGGEIMLSFLPLTHVFARTLYYGAMSRGSSLYFSHPDRLVDDMATVRPSIISTVPRVLEKVYARLIARSNEASGVKGKIARWGLSRAQSESGGSGPLGAVADRLVYRKWRAIFGGNIRWIISGGAALSKEIAEVFEAAGLTILQGYGLTETSPVIAFNRPGNNRAGTVGQPLEGVEVKLADDGEILTRGPHIMAGYFRDDDRTKEAIDDEGWLLTGDIGQFDEDGFLSITDRKKDLFKLSTGKYVMPQPLENLLSAEPLIDQTVVVGNGHKFAAALIFPNPEYLKIVGTELRCDSTSIESLCSDPKIRGHIQQIVDRANEGMSHWATIKRFVLIPSELSIENDLLTPTLKVKRSQVARQFVAEIESMYVDENREETEGKSEL